MVEGRRRSARLRMRARRPAASSSSPPDGAAAASGAGGGDPGEGPAHGAPPPPTAGGGDGGDAPPVPRPRTRGRPRAASSSSSPFPPLPSDAVSVADGARGGGAPAAEGGPRAGVGRRRPPGSAAATAASKRPKRMKDIQAAKGGDEEDDSGGGGAGSKCLPRARERALKSKGGCSLLVMGVDEAGRGPLAGPVVAAAAVVPCDVPGVTDSKKITREEDREALYERIVASPGVRWAAAVVDARRIDEINILQATMEGMRCAAAAMVRPPSKRGSGKRDGGGQLPLAAVASADLTGCYVVCGGNDVAKSGGADADPGDARSYYALVDGNRLPDDMPCDAEPVIRGDSREFAIGAASIIAKVTRDRLMRRYDEMYPQYELGRHKGYPTAAHMLAVLKHGASPIHRRTFAPLKHMTFDEEGGIVRNVGEGDGAVNE